MTQPPEISRQLTVEFEDASNDAFHSQGSQSSGLVLLMHTNETDLNNVQQNLNDLTIDDPTPNLIDLVGNNPTVCYIQ